VTFDLVDSYAEKPQTWVVFEIYEIKIKIKIKIENKLG
jgi:hypothetical protein